VKFTEISEERNVSISNVEGLAKQATGNQNTVSRSLARPRTGLHALASVTEIWRPTGYEKSNPTLFG
jgi:hypothetical protein